ncbi:MAG: ATP-binding cassette domain-containing protein [Firmicutes bacterium]|nr:ATP-binding cassette domain-containing protein [Bacillota bacterium]
MKLSVENGSFGYKGEKNILNNISFSTGNGDLLAILGPNGTGKTTLLRCIMGFLNWKSGRSTLDGVDIRSMPLRKLWNIVSYVPQAKNSLSAYKTEEMILLGRGSRLGFFSKPAAKDFQIVCNIMEKLHITNLRGKLCSEISGGELQMVLIAKALAAQPQILILDEPESNLDFKNQLIVLDTMSELADEGMTCIFNTHYPAHALRRANKALMLNGNGGALFGETQKIVTERNIEKSFGVRAIISEVETHQSTLRDVIPLDIRSSSDRIIPPQEKNAEHLAVLSITFSDSASAEKLNGLFHEYSRYIVGRMGMPYPKYNVKIINLTLDGPISDLETLTARISTLRGVNVKAVYTSGDVEDINNGQYSSY